MFQQRKRTLLIPRRSVKTEQNLRNPLPRERVAKEQTERDGHHIETKVRELTPKKQLTTAVSREVEDSIPGGREIKSKRTVGFEELNGMPAKINDRQRNKINDNKVPKLTFRT
jgi:hypothetical protein